MDQASREHGAGVRHWRLHSGARGFDALLVGVYEKEELIFVAKVKDGFVPRIRDELLRPLRRCKLRPTTSAAQQMFLIDTK